MVDVHQLMKGHSVTRPAQLRDYFLAFHSMSVHVLSPVEAGVTAISAGHSSMPGLIEERRFRAEVVKTEEPMWLYCRHKQTMSSMQKSRSDRIERSVAEPQGKKGTEKCVILDKFVDHSAAPFVSAR